MQRLWRPKVGFPSILVTLFMSVDPETPNEKLFGEGGLPPNFPIIGSKTSPQIRNY